MRHQIINVLACCMFLPLLARGYITIPGDYPDIQSGILSAQNGDTLILEPGIYIGEHEITDKSLTLASRFLLSGDTTYISATTIDGDSTYRILTVTGTEHVLISGLTLSHGFGEEHYGGAITCRDSISLRIDNCRLSNNYACFEYPDAVIVTSDYCRMSISNSLIIGNGNSLIKGISPSSSRIEVSDCQISGNLNSTISASCDTFIYVSNWHHDNTQMRVSSGAPRIDLQDLHFHNNHVATLRFSINSPQSVDSVSMRDIFIDSNSYESGGSTSIVQVDYVENLFLKNIHISNNSCIAPSSYPDWGRGLGIYAAIRQSVVADSIFIHDNYTEYTQADLRICTFLRALPVYIENQFSNIFIENNSYHRLDLDDPGAAPDNSSLGFHFFGDSQVENLVVANNSADATFGGLGFRYDVGYGAPQSHIFMRDVLIHDNSWLHIPPFSFPAFTGIIIEPESQYVPAIFEIENLTMFNQFGLFAAALKATGLDSLIIRNCSFSDIAHGFGYVDNVENVVIENCLFNNVVFDLADPPFDYTEFLWQFGEVEFINFVNTTIASSWVIDGPSIWINPQSGSVSHTAEINSCIIENSASGITIEGSAFVDTITVCYSNTTDLWFGEGNISTNSLFTDPENNDYTLQTGSPCIDAGNPDPIYNDPEDPDYPGWPLWPSQGTLRNDMGCYGGQGAIELWDYQDVPVWPQATVQPATIQLSQNYPNPFNPTTTIEFMLPYPQDVQLTVYNILGQQVQLLIDQAYSAGVHQVRFDGSGLASGVYVYRLVAGDRAVAKKMVLVR